MQGLNAEVPDLNNCKKQRISFIGLLILFIIVTSVFRFAELTDRNLTDRLLFLAGNELVRAELVKLLPSHRVIPGETLYRISRYYLVPCENLAAINRISDPTCLKIGQRIFIPPTDPRNQLTREYRVQKTNSLRAICQQFALDPLQVQRLNPTVAEQGIPAGQILLLPKVQTVSADRSGILRVARPVMQGRLTSRFGRRWGRMHYGIDLAAPTGTSVRAIAGGRVSFTGWQDGYGLLIRIGHGNLESYYAHLSQISVKAGQTVYAGMMIGRVGSTGRAYGSHLHLEIAERGRKINPLKYVNY